MFLVVDVNVILSSLLGKGNSLDIFAINSVFKKFEFVAPEFLLIELEKNTKEIFERSRLLESDFNKLKEFIKMQIRLIPESEFASEIEKAKELLGKDTKDFPYVALALKLNVPIFSGDKILKNCIPDKVFSPREILDRLFKNK